jgi:hypothetical protein
MLLHCNTSLLACWSLTKICFGLLLCDWHSGETIPISYICKIQWGRHLCCLSVGEVWSYWVCTIWSSRQHADTCMRSTNAMDTLFDSIDLYKGRRAQRGTCDRIAWIS